MRGSLKRLPALLVLAALLAVVTVRGILPAMSRVGSDFPNYLVAAQVVVEGGQVARLYDDAWFQEQMRRHLPEVPAAGKFSPFPPPTALLLVPLTPLSPLVALRVLTVASLLALAGSVVLLSRLLGWSLLSAALLVLASGYCITAGLQLGQPYILMSALCILGYYACARGRPLLGGLCLGLFVPIKYFPAIILLYFAIRRRWRVLAGGALSMVAVVLLSISVLGWDLHRQYLSSVLGSHLTAHLSQQDPFSASFQSFDTLYRTLFVFDPALNPRPLWDLPALQPVTVVLTKLCLLGLGVVLLFRLAQASGSAASAPSIGLLCLLALLLAPATAGYHFVLLWLPVGLLVDDLLRARQGVAAGLLLAMYALIGFFPYRFTAAFAGRGALTLLAYPRLLLLLAMFVVTLSALRQRLQQRAAEPPAACALLR